MNINVDTEPDKNGEGIPTAFMLGNKRIEVTEVLDRWLSEEYSYYKVRIDGEAVYILKNNKPQECWEITLYQSGTEIRSL